MKRLSANYAEKLKTFGIIILGNFLLLLYCVLLLHPVSSSNDDFFLGVIAGNGFGSHSDFLVYVSTLYGCFLKLWYQLFPSVNWYMVFCYLFLLCSVSVTEYILVAKYKFSGIILSIIFSVGFSHYFYVVFQYTKVSAMLTLTGFMILFYWIQETEDSLKCKTIKYILGSLFLFLGSLIRLQSFFMVCIFGFGIWVTKFIATLMQKEYRRFFNHFVYPLIGIFIIILGFSIFEEKVWDVSTSELSYFQAYNQVRTQLVDYQIPDYDTHKQQYEALGLSENDVDNLTRWCFADSDKFSLEVLQQIAAMNEKRVFSFKEFFKYIRDNIITHPVFKLCAILSLCCLFFAKKRKYVQLLTPHLCFLLVLVYLNYIGRITEWVLNSLWLVYLLTIMAVVCAHFPEIICSKKRGYQVCACCLCGTIFFNSDILITRATTEASRHGELYQCMNTISNSKELNFFCDVASVYNMSGEYGILEKTPENFFSNIFFSGAWFSCSPQENHTKRSAGIENIYRDILYKEDYVVLDQDAIARKELYLAQNYSPTAKYSKLQDLYGYPLFKFSDNYTGKRIESTSTATLHLTPPEQGYYEITGCIDAPEDALQGATLYLEITEGEDTVSTYAGRFEQTNAYGIYSLRYRKDLEKTNQVTFLLPENTAISSQFQYKILLCYGNDEAQVLSVRWE